jgi:large subunit ribosomal protein L24
MMWIRRDDTVEVIAGEDRGARGKVLRVDRRGGKIVVEQINRVYKHVRRSQRNPQGGRLSVEMPIAVSNALLVCRSCNAATRTGARFLADGSKERFCKKCGAGNGVIATAKARQTAPAGRKDNA